jgi:hypothetical protein
MPKPADIVHMQTVTTGTGNLTLTAVNGKQSLSGAFSTGAANNFVYYLSNQDAAEWERGEGYCSDANTLVRSTVNANSLGTTAKISFTAGTIDVVNDIPAGKQVQTTATSVTTGHAVVYESSDGTVIGSAGFSPVHSTDTSVTTGDAVVYKTADGGTIGTAGFAPVHSTDTSVTTGHAVIYKTADGQTIGTAGAAPGGSRLLQAPLLYSTTTAFSFAGTTSWGNAYKTTFTPVSTSSTILAEFMVNVLHGDTAAPGTRVDARLSRGATSNQIGTLTRSALTSNNFDDACLYGAAVEAAHGIAAETTYTVQVRQRSGNDAATVNATTTSTGNTSYLTIWEYE